MSGALFLLFVVLAAIVLVVFSLSPLLFIPIAIMVLVGLVVGPLGALIKSGQGTAPSGVPTTREASYDPQVDPSQQPAPR
jgi:hypothetical protein